MLLKELYEGMYGEINEVDDNQMIKYKDADGESQEMSAKAAKRMAKDHPAKKAYDDIAKRGDSSAKKGVNIFDKPADQPADKPKPKPKSGKPWHKVKGDDTMGHLSKKLKHKVLHNLEDIGLSHSQTFDLEVDDDGNVTYDGEVVAKIEDDTTHDDLKNQIKTGVTAMFNKGEEDDEEELAKLRGESISFSEIKENWIKKNLF